MLILYLESFRESRGSQGNTPKAGTPNRSDSKEPTLEQQLRKSAGPKLPPEQMLLTIERHSEMIRDKFMENLKKLEPSFKKFKKTHACKVLKARVEVAETIAEKVFN